MTQAVATAPSARSARRPADRRRVNLLLIGLAALLVAIVAAEAVAIWHAAPALNALGPLYTT